MVINIRQVKSYIAKSFNLCVSKQMVLLFFRLGMSVVHIKVSNLKSNLYYSVHVNVLRKFVNLALLLLHPT